MSRKALLVAAAVVGAGLPTARAAEPVMVQCGREYQAARTAGTLNGQDWNQYRTACAARLKAGTPAEAPAAAVPVTAAAPAPAAPAPAPAPAVASGGMAAMHVRQKQCGAEWRAQKATLVVQTPGLTWPRFWSQCNARLKAAR